MVKAGDIVRYLNAVGGGRVVKVSGNMAYVDDDGFETPVLIRECVVVATAGSAAADPVNGHRANAADTSSRPAPAVAAASSSAPKATDDDMSDDGIDVSEVPGGDALNITLGYESTDIRHLGQSGYEAYLINDSNYYLYFTYAGRPDKNSEWTAQYAGIVEPNTQLLLAELSPADVTRLRQIAVQIIAFKRNKTYAIKNPVNIIRDIDTTKFFKAHCFKDNGYFDRKVIACDLIKNDTPVKGEIMTPHQADMLAAGMAGPKEAVRQPRQQARKARHTSPKATPLVVDLHIHELLDSIAGLSNSDMLNVQIDKFREIMDANLANTGKKIIFIHGKGDGVLRKALLKELGYRYKGMDVQDASFREYGFGATQVTIRHMSHVKTADKA